MSRRAGCRSIRYSLDSDTPVHHGACTLAKWLTQMQIKEYAQNIVMDQFMTGQDATVVVAMPSDVALAKRKVVNTYE